MKSSSCKFSALTFIIAVLISGCSGSITDDEKVKEINSDDTEIQFDLRIGQQAVLTNQDISIELKDIPSDSRCPEDVVCVWAGNAELLLEINNTEALINTTADPAIVELNGYELSIFRLSPATNSRIKIDKDDYKAELILRPAD